uniref:Uncharacterized protein n=1 Tax=Fagus sylvatica TaxID=28930 RepID=A0A2N9F9H8_FAGSY
MNNKGRFVSLTVLRDSRGKGNVIILDGKETRGWHGFSHELDGILFLAALEKAVAEVNSDSHWRPAMNHGDSVGTDLVKDFMDLFLKVTLGRGPENKWVVTWAGVVDKPLGDTVTIQDAHTSKPVGLNLCNKLARPNKPTGPVPVPKPITKAIPMASGSRDPDNVLMHSCETESQHSDHSNLILEPQVRPIAEVFKEVGPTDKTWGSSSDWFIDLRDGRRLRIPMDLQVPVTDPAVESTQKLIQWVSSHRDGCESGCEEDNSIWGSDELEE